MREMDPKPWRWMDQDIPYLHGMKEMANMTLILSWGVPVLIAVIIEHNVWVASLGDFEGCESTSSSIEWYVTSSFIDLGSFVSNGRAVTTLNDSHNLHNAEEVQRFKKEHPGEDAFFYFNKQLIAHFQSCRWRRPTIRWLLMKNSHSMNHYLRLPVRHSALYGGPLVVLGSSVMTVSFLRRIFRVQVTDDETECFMRQFGWSG